MVIKCKTFLHHTLEILEVAINRFTKENEIDIEQFAEAKVYFSNEKGWYATIFYENGDYDKMPGDLE